MYNYGYDYNTYDYYNSTISDAAAAEMVGGFALLYLIFVWSIALFGVAAGVLEIIAMWKMFKKAGRHGWEAIIPFYNMYTLFEISGVPGANIFFMFIPCAGPIILLVYEIKAAISLSKKFHKSGGFAVLLILLSTIGYCILGFGKDEYDGSLGLQR